MNDASGQSLGNNNGFVQHYFKNKYLLQTEKTGITLGKKEWLSVAKSALNQSAEKKEVVSISMPFYLLIRIEITGM